MTTTPTDGDLFDDGQDADHGTKPDPTPPKVSVPIRITGDICPVTEHARVDPENADQWDERRWRDRP